MIFVSLGDRAPDPNKRPCRCRPGKGRVEKGPGKGRVEKGPGKGRVEKGPARDASKKARQGARPRGPWEGTRLTAGTVTGC